MRDVVIIAGHRNGFDSREVSRKMIATLILWMKVEIMPACLKVVCCCRCLEYFECGNGARMSRKTRRKSRHDCFEFLQHTLIYRDV